MSTPSCKGTFQTGGGGPLLLCVAEEETGASEEELPTDEDTCADDGADVPAVTLLDANDDVEPGPALVPAPEEPPDVTPDDDDEDEDSAGWEQASRGNSGTSQATRIQPP